MFVLHQTKIKRQFGLILNRKQHAGDEQHEEEGVRTESDENQKTIRPNLNRKQPAVRTLYLKDFNKNKKKKKRAVVIYTHVGFVKLDLSKIREVR